MPPDFSLVPGLTVTQDQRGSSFNAGVGNANPSMLGSFLEGFQDNARNWTVTRNMQLEAQTKYDPDRIAAEKLKADLENQNLQEAVNVAKVKSKYAETNAQLGIADQVVTIGGKVQDNRITTKKADLIEKYGETEQQLELQGKRASIALTNQSIANSKRAAAEEDSELGQLKKRAAILKDLAPMAKLGLAANGDPLTDSERIATLNTKNKFREKIAELDQQIADYTPTIIKAPSTEKVNQYKAEIRWHLLRLLE